MRSRTTRSRRARALGLALGAGILAALAGACTGGGGFGGRVGLGAAAGPATGAVATRTSLGATAGGAKDIGYARRVIEGGGVPDPRAITVEGVYSESDLPLEGSQPRDLLSLHLGAAVAEGAYLVQIGMSSSLDPAAWKRAPLNVCAVVDVSGSMASDGKMEAVKHALFALVRNLRDPRDVFSLVAFNHDAWVVVEPSSVPGADPALGDLLGKIDGLRATGSTNMNAGMTLGYEQIAKAGGAKQGRNARMILLTDALPNTGNFTDEGFVKLVAGRGREGIGLTAFGVGIDFGHDLARKISECPGANYKYLASRKDIESVFEADFDFLVTPLAYELALEVEPAPGFEVAETFGFPGGGLEVATVFLSRSKGALAVRLRPTGEASPRHGRLCDVRLSYRRESDGEVIRDALAAEVPPVGPGEEYFSHKGVRKTLALTMVAVAMKDACARTGPAAVGRLEHARARLEREARALSDRDLEREARLAARLLANLQATN